MSISPLFQLHKCNKFPITYNKFSRNLFAINKCFAISDFILWIHAMIEFFYCMHFIFLSLNVFRSIFFVEFFFFNVCKIENVGLKKIDTTLKKQFCGKLTSREK